MAGRTQLDLNTIETRMRAVRMSDSDRLVAMTAMRNGVMIVDAFAWLARAVSSIGNGLPAKPRLAR
jgi:hypothetical protein